MHESFSHVAPPHALAADDHHRRRSRDRPRHRSARLGGRGGPRCCSTAGESDQRRPDPEHRSGQDGHQGVLRRHAHLDSRSGERHCRAPHVLADRRLRQGDGAPRGWRLEVPRQGSEEGWPQAEARSQAEAKGGPKNAGTPAILLDVDDTTLNTYNYEIYSNFVYNPAQNAAFVNAASFPAVPGMPALVSHAASKGYQVFFLTGRPESQRPGTVTNLTNAGYATPAANHLYLKDQVNQPWLSSCSPSCTTIQYKSLTRQHIESMGFNIVANFGDQYSDLTGGFADKTFKVPNPMYYLP